MNADDRRRSLIDATIDVLGESGAADASLRLVCKKAGVSPGLISHFFDGWHDLLTEAYLSLAGRYHASLAEAISAPGQTAEEKIKTVVDTYFSDAWLTEGTGNAYVSLWSLSRSMTGLQDPMTSHNDEMTRILCTAIQEYRPSLTQSDAEDLGEAFLLFLNGVWMEMILNPTNITQERALALGYQWLERFLDYGGEG